MTHKILKNKYPNAKPVNLGNEYNTNTTILLKNTEPLLVAKIYRKGNKDAITEVNALEMLRHTSISPNIHDQFEDDSCLYIIMDYLPGINGQRYLDLKDMDNARLMYKLLGSHLAKDIHSVKADNNIELPLYGLFNKDKLNNVPADLREKTKSIINISCQNNVSLIHRDFGPHNVIINQGSVKIIDWEWAGWGNPLHDIAWVVWFVHLHYPDICNELSEVFLTEYRYHSDIEVNKDLIKAFALSSVLTILNGIPKSEAESRLEWIRRLTWTMYTDFTD